MSTRSIIGVAHDSGFEGRYCHWDGYPTARGAQLLTTYAELGNVQAVKRWAMRPGVEGYWSSYAEPSVALAERVKADRVPCTYCYGLGVRPDMVVPDGCNGCRGAGLMRNPDKHETWESNNGNGWTTDKDDCGAEWAYLLSDDGITVLASEDSIGRKSIGMFGSLGAPFGWVRYGFAEWDSEADWAAIERGALRHAMA